MKRIVSAIHLCKFKQESNKTDENNEQLNSKGFNAVLGGGGSDTVFIISDSSVGGCDRTNDRNFVSGQLLKHHKSHDGQVWV